MLRMSLCENHLDLHLTGATALLARRRQCDYAYGSACSDFETPRNSGRQGPEATVLALYLRGVPYHRVVYDVPDPVHEAATINQWLDKRGF